MAASPVPTVRPSAVAGAWYPGRPEALRQMVEGFLDQAGPAVLPGRALALVSPHAGYPYSGPTAAHAYAQVRGQSYDRVVLLGPLHRPIWGSRLGSFMVATEDAYQTPLGQVPLDRAFIDELGGRVPLTRVKHDEEHSLEIELPFLQVALAGPFELVPIMMGEHITDPGALDRLSALARAVADLVAASQEQGKRTLLVASTDLSHLSDYQEVVAADRRLVALVEAFDVDALARALAQERVMACGATGLVAILQAARLLGATAARVLIYTSSGDVTGDRRPGTYCVGYLAAAIYA